MTGLMISTGSFLGSLYVSLKHFRKYQYVIICTHE